MSTEVITPLAKKKAASNRVPPPAPGSAVDAALNYAAYAADWKLALAGEDMWAAKFGSRAKGDEILGRLETETRPDACMRILAAEVIRLRVLTQQNAKSSDAERSL